MVETLTLPAYGSASLSELVPSLLATLGGREPDALGLLRDGGPAGRICLLLVDGMGAEQLAAHRADAPFLSSLLGSPGRLTAGFPSSTPTSLSSLGTGAAPGAHGMVGVRFEASHGELLHSIRWTTERDGQSVDQVQELPPEQVQPLDTALARAQSGGMDVRVVSAREFEGSALTRAALRGGTFRGVRALGDLAAELITALNAPPPVFCYGYHSHLDVLGHVHGPGSLAWRLELSVVDRVAALVAEALPPDGMLVVTADHGMVEVPQAEQIDFDSDAALRNGVRLIGGDARARQVYAQPGAAAEVLTTWTERLGDRAWVRSGEQAIAEGWYGPTISSAARLRIGDVVAALRGGASVVRAKASRREALLLGQHGSLTAAEQHIPLLMTRG